MGAGRQLLIPKQVRAELVKSFGVNDMTLWNALNYRSNSGIAKMLRVAAFERGGRVWDGSIMYYKGDIDCEPEHDTVEKRMTYNFSERVKLVADFKGKMVGVYVDGLLKMKYSCLSILEFMLLLNQVQEVSNKLDLVEG